MLEYQDDVVMCEICTQIYHTGDFTVLDYYYHDEEDVEAEMALIKRNMEKLGKAKLVMFSSTEEEAYIEDFSRQKCYLCHYSMPGKRYPHVLYKETK